MNQIDESGKNEILEAINIFAQNTEERFNKMESDIGLMKGDIGSMKGEISVMKGDIGSMKGDIGSMKGDIGSMKGDIGSIKGSMVTQSIFHQAMDAMENRLMDVIQTEDQKLGAHIVMTRDKGVLNEEEMQSLLAMPPFAKRATH